MATGCDAQQFDLPELRADMPHTRWLCAWESRTLLLRVARRHNLSAEDAEDVVQEAILRAAEHPEIPEHQLRAWLVVVTTRLCQDQHRRRASETRRWRRQAAHAVVQQPGQYLEEEVCDRSEAGWVTTLAAELLPPRQEKALRLAASGCDVQQVASQLGVRYRAAESLLARARRTLRIAVTVGLGLLVWMGRLQPPTAGSPGAMALASPPPASISAAPVQPLPHYVVPPRAPQCPQWQCPAPPKLDLTELGDIPVAA